MPDEGTALGPRYRALALQTRCDAINTCTDRAAARAQMLASIARIGREVAASKAFVGGDLRLVVLPEYVITGYPLGESVAEWADKAALVLDGPEYAAFARIAQGNDLYLAGNAYEIDAHFPGLYFQTSFVIDPSGHVALRYRRLNSMFAPTPHDVWSRYLDIYGLEAVFPVARTPIGNLAAIASEEILYPEIARCLAMRGAEIFVHSSAEIGSPRATHKFIAKAARAIENMAYVISANTGGMTGQALPMAATDGDSAIIDHQGQVLAQSGHGPTMTAFAAIDLNALRHERRRPGMNNYLARQRFELFAETYARLGSQPANALLDPQGGVTVPGRAHFKDTQAAIIARLIADSRL